MISVWRGPDGTFAVFRFPLGKIFLRPSDLAVKGRLLTRMQIVPVIVVVGRMDWWETGAPSAR